MRYGIATIDIVQCGMNDRAIESIRGSKMSLKARAQEKIERAGISNYSFDRDTLIMCGIRYAIEICDCGDRNCDGVRLREFPGGSRGTLQ